MPKACTFRGTKDDAFLKPHPVSRSVSREARMGWATKGAGLLLAIEACEAFTGGMMTASMRPAYPGALQRAALSDLGQRSSHGVSTPSWIMSATRKALGSKGGKRRTSMASKRSAKLQGHEEEYSVLFSSRDGSGSADGLVGFAPSPSKPGFAYGPAYGPSHDRSWALEAAMQSSMRRTLINDPDVGDVEVSVRASSSTTAGRSGASSAQALLGGEPAASHRMAMMESSLEEPLCGCLAENLFRLMRITLRGEKDELRGLLTEVQSRGKQGPVLTILKDDGSFVTASAMDVEEVVVCTVGGNSDSAAIAHLAAHGGPTHALSDVCLVLMRGLSASLGRQVLVQNLRHVIVGFSGCRALWSDLLLGQEERGLGAGAMSKWAESENWMVKVLSESDRLGGVDGGRWVPVSWVLPMSEYDLQVYSTYRHDTLPSSEYDLQRHDPLLMDKYRSKHGYSYDDLALVG